MRNYTFEDIFLQFTQLFEVETLPFLIWLFSEKQCCVSVSQTRKHDGVDRYHPWWRGNGKNSHSISPNKFVTFFFQQFAGKLCARSTNEQYQKFKLTQYIEITLSVDTKELKKCCHSLGIHVESKLTVHVQMFNTTFYSVHC